MTEHPLLFRPGTLLRVEALLVLIAGCASYHHWFPHHWVLFACLFLVPDLSLIPYRHGPSTAASIGYNSAHSYLLPALLGVIFLCTGSLLSGEASLIWISHIAVDRTLGYGLKDPTSFAFTHSQSAGAARP